MKKIVFIILLSLILAPPVLAASITAKSLAGQIIYVPGEINEFWFVNSKNFQRSPVLDFKVALNVFKNKFIGLSEANFKKLVAVGDMPIKSDLALAKKLAGRIILRVDKNGAAWYINPTDLKKYDLSASSTFFNNLPLLATKVSATQLAQIHKPSLAESINKYSSYEYTRITTVDGIFPLDIVKIDLSNPNLKIITATADSATCHQNCHAKSLMDYITPVWAFAGINGTYFCSSASCGTPNYYFFPVYNTANQVLINSDQLKYWTTGPMMAFDTNNKFYYFKDSRDFKSVADFEKNYGVKLQAAIGNKPRLVEAGMNALINWEVDPGQLNGKYWRNAIGYKDNKTNGHGIIYLIVVRNATLDDLAGVVKKMGLDYAINLDGGSSTALFYNDEYMEGPGRNIPNVIMFSE